MLQQTQVATATPYFDRFVARFPSVEVLAQADLQSVLKAWEGLGYYSRARNLHRAAQKVVAEFAGEIPGTHATLLELPGIGSYTAAAIASIAFGEPVPVVDGNVLRVCARLWGIDDDIKVSVTRDAIFARLEPVIRECDPSEFNQAMMELGALVCRPRNAACADCPLAGRCIAFRDSRTSELPVKSGRRPVPHYDIAVGVVFHRGKILIGRRGEDQMLGGLWEFPGGKVEHGEELAETAIREIREETGLAVAVLGRLEPVRHAYSHFRITLAAFVCRRTGGRLRRVSADRPFRWVAPTRLRRFPFPRANTKVLELLDVWLAENKSRVEY